MSEQILKVWPVPPAHVGLKAEEPSQLMTADVDLAQLVASGWIEPGTMLVPRASKYEGVTALVAQDGRLFIGDTAFQTPTAASVSVHGAPNNGWRWWVIKSNGQSLHELRADFVVSLGREEVADGNDVAGEAIDETGDA